MLTIVQIIVLGSLCACRAASSTVPPPSRISVECHNFKNVLRWDYSEPSLQPLFFIEIRSYLGGPVRTLNTTKHFVDVSAYTKAVENSYELTITAKVGPEESVGVSAFFSYDQDMARDHTCILDVPPLNVSLQSGVVGISFMHPYYLYQELHDSEEDLDTDFVYSVSSSAKFQSGRCLMVNAVCKAQFLLGEGWDAGCVDIYLEGTISNIFINRTERICPIRTPSPSNVSVDCHNFTNVLRWDYSKPSLQPEFFIEISSYMSGAHWNVSTAERHVDVSAFTMEMEDSYQLTVTAVVGFERSEGVPVVFSYDQDLAKDHTCVLDSPPLNVSAKQDVLRILFTHPYAIYRKSFERYGKTDMDFSYTIAASPGIQVRGRCVELDEACVAELHLTEGMAVGCLDLHFEGTIRNINTNRTERVCREALPPETNQTLAVVVGCTLAMVLVLLLGGGALWMWSRTRSWVMANLPKTLAANFTSTTPSILAPEGPSIDLAQEATVSLINVSPNESPVSSPVSSPQEEALPTQIVLEVQEEAAPEEPGYSVQKSEMSSEEEEPGEEGQLWSGYDSPHVLDMVEMSPNDTVECYGPR